MCATVLKHAHNAHNESQFQNLLHAISDMMHDVYEHGWCSALHGFCQNAKTN